MAENLDKWPSKRGPISKIRPSDGCKTDAVPLAVDQWYDFHEFGCHLGIVGLPQLAIARRADQRPSAIYLRQRRRCADQAWASDRSARNLPTPWVASGDRLRTRLGPAAPSGADPDPASAGRIGAIAARARYHNFVTASRARLRPAESPRAPEGSARSAPGRPAAGPWEVPIYVAPLSNFESNIQVIISVNYSESIWLTTIKIFIK